MQTLKLFVLTIALCFTFEFVFCQDVIKGTIQNDKGVAIAGASVKIKNSKKETSTDESGNFTLHAKTGESIIITAIGFADTTITINQTTLLVKLKPEINVLKPVTVNANKQTSSANIAHEQIIQDMFNEFMAKQFSFSNFHGLELPNAAQGLPLTNQTTLTEHSMSSVYRGEAFPEFHTKEDTKGSTYLFKNWIKGAVVDSAGNLIDDTTLFFNYNKITGELISTKDFQKAMYSNADAILVFALHDNDDNSTHVFAYVPAIDKTHFSEVLVMGNNIGIFKLTETKFVKSDYHSDGITSSGNNYDEYVDNNTYYLFNIKDNTLIKFDLKKKNIRQAFENIATANDYFSQHKNDDIDDAFLKGLGNNINNQSN